MRFRTYIWAMFMIKENWYSVAMTPQLSYKVTVIKQRPQKSQSQRSPKLDSFISLQYEFSALHCVIPLWKHRVTNVSTVCHCLQCRTYWIPCVVATYNFPRYVLLMLKIWVVFCDSAFTFLSHMTHDTIRNVEIWRNDFLAKQFEK